jgi:2-dehydropantoate 2-reductase
MRIAIYGAGAIGGLLGAYLARAQADVSLIARGPHLAAMRANGLEVRGTSAFTTRPRCTDDARELGEQDYVIIALKAPAVLEVVDRLQSLLGPTTTVVFAVNGVPWWYFYKHPGRYENHRLHSVDPGDRQWEGIGPERALGCVVYPAAEIVEPGVVEHVAGDRFVLGEPSGELSERAQKLSRLLIEAGLKAPVRPRIRDEIWVKLWGNLSFNPLSALTGATLDVIVGDPGTRSVVRAMMREAQAIGTALGVRFGIDIDRRIQGAAAVGVHKTSMLQDLERGRPMEIDALVTSVQEIARLVGIPTPTIDTILPLVQQRARLAGCYP